MYRALSLPTDVVQSVPEEQATHAVLDNLNLKNWNVPSAMERPIG
jgi:hypothetical protein